MGGLTCVEVSDTYLVMFMEPWHDNGLLGQLGGRLHHMMDVQHLKHGHTCICEDIGDLISPVMRQMF